MEQILISWVGGKDLAASRGEAGQHTGPVAAILAQNNFDRIELLANYPAADVNAYLDWLAPRGNAVVSMHEANLSSPVNFAEIYEAANSVLTALLESAPDSELHIPLPPLQLQRKYEEVYLQVVKNLAKQRVASTTVIDLFGSLSQELFSRQI